MTDPRATYRIQLQPGFGFHEVATLGEHLERLGISHVYASPIAQAVPGSTHGYDVVDPGTVNPELGGPEALTALHAVLRAHGLGILVDMVPNHLAAHDTNRWWWALLAEGHGGPGDVMFDVEWDAPGVGGRVVLPLLGTALDDAIAAHDVAVEEHNGEVVVRAPGLVLPVAPGTGAVGDRAADVLAAQHYRLDFWRTGEEIVNYRRFFDVATLPAVRVERREVFDTQTALVARLLADGIIDGIRIDHVDGLRDPAGFLAWCREIGAQWLLVEKVLGRDEALPAVWDVDGTTGYELAERAGGVLVDPAGEAPLTELWVELSGDARTFVDYEHEGRMLVLDRLFRANLGRIGRAFARAVGNRADLRAVLTAILARFTVYRTYVDAGATAGPVDHRLVTTAVAAAISDGADPDTAAAVQRVLLGDSVGPAGDEARLRFQQLCAAVTAKGVEDTAGYRYLRLLARNEVGGDPGRFAWSVADLHAANRAAMRHPYGLLALSTHDTKRAADVRARIAVLSEIPAAWRAFVDEQRARLAPAWSPVEPDPATEYLLLQTAVGAWPIDATRLGDHVMKAAREAKHRTSWRAHDDAFEAALLRVVAALYEDDARAAVDRLVDDILVAGRINALVQVILQCTTPGVPDVYWGDELWNLTLVDPDNRRIPSPSRIALLEELTAPTHRPPLAALADPDDPGRPKLWTLHRCLDLRRRRPNAFGPGADYAALPAVGPGHDHVIAWTRDSDVVAVVPRLTRSRPASWETTTIVLPDGTWRDVFTGRDRGAGPISVGSLLTEFPVSLLERTSPT